VWTTGRQDGKVVPAKMTAAREAPRWWLLNEQDRKVLSAYVR